MQKAVENFELKELWDTLTDKYKRKTKPDYPDRTSVEQAYQSNLEKRLAFRAQPKRQQNLTKVQVEKFIPAIKLLHETKTDFACFKQFLADFE